MCHSHLQFADGSVDASGAGTRHSIVAEREPNVAPFERELAARESKFAALESSVAALESIVAAIERDAISTPYHRAHRFVIDDDNVEFATAAAQ